MARRFREAREDHVQQVLHGPEAPCAAVERADPAPV